MELLEVMGLDFVSQRHIELLLQLRRHFVEFFELIFIHMQWVTQVAILVTLSFGVALACILIERRCYMF